MYPNDKAGAFMIDFFDKNRTHPRTWVRDITFEDISVVSAKTLGHFNGPASCIEGFTVRNVTVGGAGGWGGCAGVDLKQAAVESVRPALSCHGCSGFGALLKSDDDRHSGDGVGIGQQAPPSTAKVVDTVHAPKEVRSSLIGLEKLETDETRSDVGAIYFGDWAPDPWMEAMHGTNWTEWQLPIHAQPRYPGHFQPNLPLETAGWGPAHPESDPANMAIKIDAAADHGIDFFMFDWYHLCQIILATVFLFLRS